MPLVIPFVCDVCGAVCVAEPCPGETCFLPHRPEGHVHYRCPTGDAPPFAVTVIKSKWGDHIQVMSAARTPEPHDP